MNSSLEYIVVVYKRNEMIVWLLVPGVSEDMFGSPRADHSSRRRVGDLRVCEDGALPRMISNAGDATNTHPPKHRN